MLFGSCSYANAKILVCFLFCMCELLDVSVVNKPAAFASSIYFPDICIDFFSHFKMNKQMNTTLQLNNKEGEKTIILNISQRGNNKVSELA